MTLRHTVKFEPGDPPRTGQVAFCAPEGTRSVPIGDAVPLLLGATQPPTSASAHPTAAFWAAVTVAALRLIEQGRVLPGDVDTWQVGPLEPADFDRIRDLAAAMPAGATAPAQTEMPEAAVRQFFDAIADWITRTPATASSGVRISLRLEHAEPTNEFRAVVQVHSLAEPSLVADAPALWAGADLRFGATARADTLLAVRRAARVWPVLDRLLDNAVPDELALADDEVGELLGAMTGHLAAAGVEVHWPRELARELTATAVVGKAATAAAQRGDEHQRQHHGDDRHRSDRRTPGASTMPCTPAHCA